MWLSDAAVPSADWLSGWFVPESSSALNIPSRSSSYRYIRLLCLAWIQHTVFGKKSWHKSRLLHTPQFAFGSPQNFSNCIIDMMISVSFCVNANCKEDRSNGQRHLMAREWIIRYTRSLFLVLVMLSPLVGVDLSLFSPTRLFITSNILSSYPNIRVHSSIHVFDLIN